MSGCGTTKARLISAAETRGKAEARTQLPDLPASCRKHMERVKPKAGDKARWIDARWEASADAIDRQIDGCAAFHDDLRTKFAGK